MSEYIPIDDLYQVPDDDEVPFEDVEEVQAARIDSESPHISIPLTIDDLSLEEKLETLPRSPGVYQFKNGAGRVIYIGKAKVLRNRVRSYFQNFRRGGGDAKLRALVQKIGDLEVIITDSDVEALILENTLIKKLKPRYNVNLKDDKTYPYVVITNEPFPRVFPTRRKIHDGSKYYGPYTEAGYLRYLLKTLRDIFPLRTCDYAIDAAAIEKKKYRTCLEYHIKRCEGPCEGLVSQEHYAEMIRKIRKLLAGRTRDVEQDLKADMLRLADEMRFEDAARVRDQLALLEDFASKQKVVTDEGVDRDIFATTSEDDDACGIVFKVRDGKLVGKQQFFFSGTEHKDQDEILEALLERYYSIADFIPHEILLPIELENTDTLQLWLANRARILSNDEEAMSPPKIHVPKIGEKVKLVDMVRANATFLLGEIKLQKMKQAEHIPHVLRALQRDLNMKAIPHRIECFDNSHFQGSETVSSMVVFENGKAKKSDYRKYKIRTVEGVDDFKSMREVVFRRYSHLLKDKLALPDLIIIDGGKGQLSSAFEVMKELELTHIPMIGLAKRLEEVFIIGSNEPLILPRSSSSLRLLQQARDEAHRFAITFHRQLRDKRTFQTELREIPGVGPKRAIKLLEHFGSVSGVKQASEPELASVVGVQAMRRIRQFIAEHEATVLDTSTTPESLESTEESSKSEENERGGSNDN